MKPILFLVGQTATGKTDAALAIADHLPSMIISADSRQVYQGMEIGTGAVLPATFAPQQIQTPTEVPSRYFSDGKTEVWLSSCIQPNEEWSAAHFVRAARWCLKRAWENSKLPIIVGGTGLYMEHLLQPPASLFIPPNPVLRHRHAHSSVEELQKIVQKENPVRWSHMNQSDRANPRRLIRALEAAQLATQLIASELPALPANSLWLGLSAQEAWLDQRIRQRVEQRASHGMIEETQALLEAYPIHPLSLSATGYPETEAFLNGKMTRSEWLDLWTLHEQQYAKRQATWFAKRSQILWFPAEDFSLHDQLIQRVKTWYNAVQHGNS